MKTIRLIGLAFIACFTLAARPPEHDRWVGSWATSQQIPEPRNALPEAALTDATLRQTVRLSLGGARVRILLSNAFGTEPLRIDSAHVARAAGGAAVTPGTDHALTFDGAPDVRIPAGASYWSDPVAIQVPALSSVTISLHLPAAPKGQTSHPGSRATSYLVPGNHVADPTLPGARAVEHWFQIAGVAVAAPSPAARSIVTLGDSITDGHGATTDGNDRWPDLLANRLHANRATATVGVLNHGIGGNRVLSDGLGPNMLARFDRDVLAQPGVRYLIVLEGINDLGTLTREAPVSAAAHAALVARMIGAYRQVIARAHAAGIKVYGATILPDGGSGYYHPDAQNEADRAAVNAWIRAAGHFDAVIDFDALMRDPGAPTRLRKEYDSGDGLHPSPVGYRAMAGAIPLGLFR
ncbi:SGNH/GDSL hydrolase family protein [Sphingomonas echinoides]|uniref:SGNH/GDSL hydrolase family protein n=1 Tax=Sphingomonas echinoides TaxID=59803 RepID=UPI0024138514|nr:SGNH/GDSL hydrolase family protein [Sphingomonas echinoides]